MSLRTLALAAIVAAGLAHAVRASEVEDALPAPGADSAERPAIVTRGKVSWYGSRFAGRPTASGEAFDPDAMTMAHRTLPMGTLVRVTNTRNQRSVVLRVNDRGPATGGRIGDVSKAAAVELGMLRAGVVEARIEVVREAEDAPDGQG